MPMKEGGSGHANNNNKCSVLTAATSHLTQPTMLGPPLVHLHTSLFDRRAAYLQPFRPDHDHGTSLITDVTYLVTENWANSVLEILASLFVAAPFVAIGGYFMFKTCRHRR